MSNKILYVMGHGHSGSTLLDIILGSCANVVGVGELTNFEQQGWMNNEYCSCGEPVRECIFWSQVKNEMDNRGYKDLQKIIEVKRQVERNKRKFNTLLNKNIGESGILKNYMDYNRHLLESISKISGNEYIVDSSKLVTRAYFLSQSDKYEFYLLHLVRDPRGVCYSIMKSYKKDLEHGLPYDIPGKSLMAAVRSCLGTFVFTNKVKKFMRAKSLIVRYEDLFDNPEKVMREITNITGINFIESLSVLETGLEVKSKHTVAGNRMRLKKNNKLVLDSKWRTGLSTWQKILISIFTYPLLRKYGYKLRVPMGSC